MNSLTAPLSFLAAVALTVAVAVGASAAPTAVAADGDPITWSVKPIATAESGPRPTFEYAVDPGTQINDTVVVVNSGTVAATFTVYATDAINDFDSGGLSLLTAEQEPTDLGSWITVAAPEIALQPGTEATIPFTALIPSDATPGDHVAGIVASIVTDGTSEGQAVQLDQRVGARVNLRVSGAISASAEASGLVAGFTPSWNPFAPGTMSIDYAVENTGNVRLDVAQRVTITGPFGIPLGTFTPAPVQNVLPGQDVRVTADVPAIAALAMAFTSVDLEPAPVAGTEPAADVDYEASTATTISAAISWTLLALTVLVLVLGWLVWRYVTGTRERLYDAIDEAAAEARENALREREGEGEGDQVIDYSRRPKDVVR